VEATRPKAINNVVAVFMTEFSRVKSRIASVSISVNGVRLLECPRKVQAITAAAAASGR
jgi:hypothetical protein